MKLVNLYIVDRRLCMKKILFVIDSLQGGGAEKVLVDLVENIDKSKFNITVMTTLAGGVYEESIRKNVAYKTIFPNKFSTNNLIGKIINKINGNLRHYAINYVPQKLIHFLFVGNKYDVEIAFLEGHATKFIAASTNQKSKKIAWVHTDLTLNNWGESFYKDINKQIEDYNIFDSIYCVSKQASESFKEKIGRKEGVFVLYNPVNEKKVRELSVSKCEVQFNSNTFNIISVGRFTHEKGFDRLLLIHKKLILNGFFHHLYILGEGKDRKFLEQIIEQNNLCNTVTLLGFSPNPYNYMKQADLLVCSSRAEGYSLVVAEALVLGIPVISTDCNGPCELLNFGEYGMITENNESALYNGIRNVFENKDLYNYYKIKAKERGETFKLEKVLNEIYNIFNN